MIQEETNQTITTTHEKLTTINHELTKTLQDLYDPKGNLSLREHDRKIIREIRNKNLETIQLIDRMSYIEEVELQ